MEVQYRCDDVMFTLVDDGQAVLVALDLGSDGSQEESVPMADFLKVAEEIKRLRDADKPPLEELAPPAQPASRPTKPYCPACERFVTEADVYLDDGVRKHLAEPQCRARIEERVA